MGDAGIYRESELEFQGDDPFKEESDGEEQDAANTVLQDSVISF